MTDLPLAYRLVTELPTRKVARPASPVSTALSFVLFIGALATVCAFIWVAL